jgi:hypothetical protein
MDATDESSDRGGRVHDGHLHPRRHGKIRRPGLAACVASQILPWHSKKPAKHGAAA